MARQSISTYYDILKVSRDAPPEVIRAAYRSLTQMHHPDRNSAVEGSAALMSAINAAYTIISDPARRMEHDAWIEQQESGAQEPRSAFRSERTNVVVVRGRAVPPSIPWSRYAKRAGLVLAVLIVSGAVYPLFEERAPWLDQAWRQAWNRDSAGQALLAGPMHAEGATAEAISARGLAWETDLRRMPAPPLRALAEVLRNDVASPMADAPTAVPSRPVAWPKQ